MCDHTLLEGLCRAYALEDSAAGSFHTGRTGHPVTRVAEEGSDHSGHGGTPECNGDFYNASAGHRLLHRTSKLLHTELVENDPRSDIPA